MRVYRADGSYKDNPNDTGFGWYLSDLQPENLTREQPTDLVSMTNKNICCINSQHF